MIAALTKPALAYDPPACVTASTTAIAVIEIGSRATIDDASSQLTDGVRNRARYDGRSTGPASPVKWRRRQSVTVPVS